MTFSKSLRKRKTLKRKTLRRKTLMRKSRKGGAAAAQNFDYTRKLVIARNILYILKPLRRGKVMPEWLIIYFADIMKDEDVITFTQIISDSKNVAKIDDLKTEILNIFNTDTRGNESRDRDYKKLWIEINRDPDVIRNS